MHLDSERRPPPSSLHPLLHLVTSVVAGGKERGQHKANGQSQSPLMSDSPSWARWDFNGCERHWTGESESIKLALAGQSQGTVNTHFGLTAFRDNRGRLDYADAGHFILLPLQDWEHRRVIVLTLLWCQ